MVVQPKLAAEHVAPWILNGPQPTKAPAPVSTGDDDLGEGLAVTGLVMLARSLLS
jgi:hypothetical protein